MRAAISLVHGTITQRLVEPRSLATGELELTVLPVLLGPGPLSRLQTARAAQPPETALMMWTRAPAGTGAAIPAPRVASSPLTKIFT